MAIKKIKVQDLDNYLSDGTTICSILSDGIFDALFVEEWGETYNSDEDSRINQDMDSYRRALYAKESQRSMKDS